jgi:hypothetical protein
MVFLRRFTCAPDHRYVASLSVPRKGSGSWAKRLAIHQMIRQSSPHHGARPDPACTGISCRRVSAQRALRSPPGMAFSESTFRLQPRRPHAPCSPSSPLVRVVFARGKGAHPRSDDQGLSACRGSWSPSWPGPVMDAMDGYASESGRRWPSGARLRPAARCSGRSVASTVAARQRRARDPQKGGRPRRRR